MYYNSHLYNAMQFAKRLHFIHPSEPREGSFIHSFTKHLLGPTTHCRAPGSVPHHGKGGALAPWNRCSGSGCRTTARTVRLFKGPLGATCLTFGW